MEDWALIRRLTAEGVPEAQNVRQSFGEAHRYPAPWAAPWTQAEAPISRRLLVDVTAAFCARAHELKMRVGGITKAFTPTRN